jgi:thiol-disulfide isomerase/thioredoxin
MSWTHSVWRTVAGPSSGEPGRRSDFAVLICLLVASLTLNVWLFRNGGRLLPLPPEPPPALQVGATLPPMPLESLSGDKTILRWDSDQPTIVYVFSTTCPWCLRNLNNINELHERLKTRARFVALAVDSGDAALYVKATGFTLPVYHKPTGDTLRLLGGGVPQTVVLAADGKVTDNWVGAYTGVIATQVEQRFGVQLPGLTAQAAMANATSTR